MASKVRKPAQCDVLESHVKFEGRRGRLCQVLQMDQVICALRTDLAINVEVIGGLDECCFPGGEVKIWGVCEK